MCVNIKTLLLLALPLAMLSCMKDSDKDCKVELEFIFNYNMEYADSFNPQIKTVDVHIFDSEGKYMFHKRANSQDLRGGNKMTIDRNLISGPCQVIALGGFSEHFGFTDLDNNDCLPGVTTIEEVKLALIREGNRISHEFPHLWFGETTFNYSGKGRTVWPVYLCRTTNKFHLGVVSNTPNRAGGNDIPAFSFEIVTPEGGAYGYHNNPLTSEIVTYLPFLLSRGSGVDSGAEDELYIMSQGKINTMRLLSDYDGYKLVIKNPSTSAELWSYDLMALLEKTKPLTRPDGSALTFQEYLDRQGNWNIVILSQGGASGEDGFVALAIQINDWLLWLKDIEI